MFGSSIYASAWTNLVFEGKNKAYGAYQLRRENPKTTLKALLMGVGLMAGLSSLPYLLSSFDTVKPIVKPTNVLPPVTAVVVKVEPKAEPAKPKAPVAKPLAQPATPTLNNNTRVVSTPVETPTVSTPTGQTANTNPTGTGSGIDPGPTGGTPGGTGTTPEVTTAPTIEAPVVAVDKAPEFPGGIQKFREYIQRNFKTPDANDMGTDQVRILVQFVVEKDGTLTDIKVLRNPGYGLDKEAIRVLKSIKARWTAGQLAGKAVRTVYSIPIAIQAPQ